MGDEEKTLMGTAEAVVSDSHGLKQPHPSYNKVKHGVSADLHKTHNKETHSSHATHAHSTQHTAHSTLSRRARARAQRWRIVRRMYRRGMTRRVSE